MQGRAPDERRRALGDLQLEARQLAERQRGIGEEAAEGRGKPDALDRSRRLAGEQQPPNLRDQRPDERRRLAPLVDEPAEEANRLRRMLGGQGILQLVDRVHSRRRHVLRHALLVDRRALANREREPLERRAQAQQIVADELDELAGGCRIEAMAEALVARHYGADAGRTEREEFERVFRDRELPEEIPEVAIDVAAAGTAAALVALAQTAALETGAFGIRVNAVAPGMVRSHMTASLPLDVMEEALRRAPLGRLGEPEDVVGPILFLCSPLARYITGTVVRVDGGQLLG